MVYKIKKPVDFGFLDFTTLEKRRFFCREEIRLNRRLAPDVYLGVVPIYKAAAGLLLPQAEGFDNCRVCGQDASAYPKRGSSTT